MSRIEFLGLESVGPIAWVVAPIVLVLSAVAWKRSHFRPAIFVLELLRIAIVAMVLFALSQPERVESEPSTELPKVAVIWDDSLSMETRDVLPVGSSSGGPMTRSEWVGQNLDLEALRTALADRFEVLGGPISGLGGELGTDPQGGDGESGPADEDAEGSTESVATPATDLAGPLARTLAMPDVRAVVLLGDGDWNEGGDPADVAMKYRVNRVPIYTATVGSRQALPDVEFLPLEPPSFALVAKPLAVPYAIRSAMDRDLRVPVTLVGSDGQRVTEEILLPARGIYEGSLTITPRNVGTLTVEADVPLQSGELDEDNNRVVAEIDVREESLRVLLVESYPRWEYRYLRNAMVRDPGVEVDCFLFHPDIKAVGGGPHYLEAFPTKQELSGYDVVFLGDVGCEPDQLSADQCSMLRGLVAEQASGLILMPGMNGHQGSLADTDLAALMPVELDPGAPYGHGSKTPAQLLLTERGRKSTLTKLAADDGSNVRLWQDLPGFQWHAAVLRSLPGASVLAVHNSRDDGNGRVPLLATRNFGTGKVLFMGTDGAWRWREGLEDKVHYRFWRQVVRWMAYQRKMNAGESMRLFYSPDRPAVRTLTTLYANVMDAAGAPLQEADLTARIVAPSGRIDRTKFEADEGEWGLYRSTFRATEPGDHEVVLTCRDTGEQLQATLSVAGVPLERIGQPARHDVMGELARVSRGRVIQGAELASIEGELLGLEIPPAVIRRTRIWSHPLLGSLMVLLMAAFWIGRKLVGRF